MGFKIFYNSDFYLIQVDVAQNLLVATWLRPVNTEELILGGTKLYEVLLETKVERAMANAQAFTTLSTEAKEWMSSIFYQLLSDTNLKKLARILPGTVFYKLALESVVTRAEALGVTKFLVQNFFDEPTALSWLTQE